MFQKQVEEDEVQMLPDVEAAIVEWINQEVAAPVEELEADWLGGKRLRTMRKLRKSLSLKWMRRPSGSQQPPDTVEHRGCLQDIDKR